MSGNFLEMENVVDIHVNENRDITDKLKEYSAAKLREAEKREQEMLEKPLFIELLLARIKCKFR